MERTWKPTTAGILCIIAGAIGLLSGMTVAVIGSIAGAYIGVPLWTGAVGVPFIVSGILSIVGGIYALKRRIWGLALAGSICALWSGYLILGILAIIFVAMGKDEFE